MNAFTIAILRRALSSGGATSVAAGETALSLPLLRLLPAEAVPHMHYVNDVMCLLPGVTSAQAQPENGRILVQHDTAVSTEAVRAWYQQALAESLAFAASADIRGLTEKDTTARLKERLQAIVPQAAD